MYYAYRPWLAQAWRDLDSAAKSYSAGDLRTCAQLSRLSCEKALKAYYVSLNGRAPEGEHSVSDLIKMLGLKELELLLHDTEGGSVVLTPGERSLNLARKVVELVARKLP